MKVIDGYCFLTLIKSVDLKIQPAVCVYEFTGKASAGGLHDLEHIRLNNANLPS